MENEQQEEPRVLDVGALRALGHPLRVRIYDILSRHGAQTSSTLAGLTGESSGAMSYHLRMLARHDLIREVPGRTGRERWWERPRHSISFGEADQRSSPAMRAAQQVAASELLRRQHEDLIDYLTRRIDDEPEEWRRASTSRTSHMRLTAEQTQELMERLFAVMDETSEKYAEQQGEGVRPVLLGLDIFPVARIGEET
jgi:DNA-binding transcriptional ArsR family regulator